MKKTSVLIGLVLITLLASCATGIKGTKNEITQKTIAPALGFGVAFGRICGGNGLWFRSKDHPDEKYLHIGGKTAFAIQLPQGTYQLVSVGSPVGEMVTDKPMEFTVTAGVVNYVGSLLPRWNGGYERFPDSCKSEETKIVRTFIWSFGTGKTTWDMDVANDLEHALIDIKTAFPLLDTSQSQISLMH